MKRHIKWVFALLAILQAHTMNSQATLTALDKVKQCIDQYKETAVFGSTTKEMSNDANDNFRLLFTNDAAVFWDLYQADSLRIDHQLTVEEYIKETRDVYKGFRPPVTFDDKKYKPIIGEEKTNAVVYLVKNVEITLRPGESKIDKRKLRMVLRIYDSKALISSIEEDARATIVRSVGLNIGYTIWNNVNHALVGSATFKTTPDYNGEYTISLSPQFNAGINVDFRFNRNKATGILLETGLFYSQSQYLVKVKDYSYEYREVLDEGEANSFECSIYEGSELSEEKIETRTIMLPLDIKVYLNNWIYLKGGPMISYNQSSMTVSYDLTRGGGGRVVSDGHEIILDEQERFYEERYDMFKNKSFSFDHDPEYNDIGFSFFLGAGFEKKFPKKSERYSLGLEPLIFINPDPFYSDNNGEQYRLYPDDNYTKFMNTLNLPQYSLSFMISLRFAYIFKY